MTAIIIELLASAWLGGGLCAIGIPVTDKRWWFIFVPIALTFGFGSQVTL